MVGILAARVCGQEIETTIDLSSLAASKVGISGSFVNDPSSHRNISFVRSVAGIEGLSTRISELRLFDAKNTAVSFKQ